MRFRLPNKIQSVFKNSCLFLLGLSCILFTGCQYWYRDMKGYLEYWSGTVQVGNVSYSASPQIQKNSSGVDTVSSNATITASVDIINPEGYLLDGGVGSAADALRSVRISGESGSAALSRTTVTSSSNTRMDIEIAPLSMVPTPESLKLEHTDFTLTFTPTRSENGVSAAETKTVTLRYNTPPRMPLEVVYNQDTQQLDWMGVEKWELVQGTSSALDDLIFWAYPSGISSSTHPDHVVKFEVYEDDVLFDEYTPEECLMSGQSNLQPHVPQDLKDAGYNIYYSLATSGKEVTIYAVDSEGVRSLAATSGKAPYAITLNANGGSFGTSNTVTVYRADGSHLNGGDLDIPTKDGYYLSGWTENGNPVTFPYTVSAPVTLTAQWTPNPVSGGGSDGGDSDGGTDGGDGGVVTPSTYTVTFDAAGGKFADGKNIMTETVQSGTAVSQPSSPTRDGWVFTWWKDPKTGSAYDFSKPVTGSFTLTANWTQEFYVNPTSGDDTNLGTQDKPLATIQAAVGKINDLNDGSSAYTILLMGDVRDSSSVAYVSGKNFSLVNIVPAATLNLTIKSNIDGTTRTIDAGRDDISTGRVMYVGAKASVTLQDVVVTGGYVKDTSGGGVCVDSGGIFIMNDGIISDNYAGFDGGGVYVSPNAAFIMRGGSIKTNDVDAGAGNYSGGGGVYVNGGTFTMEDGEITQNNGLKNGGGVYVGGSGTLSMSGGEIFSNTVNGNGGGVYVSADSTFTMTSGITVPKIIGNEADGNGGGVYAGGTLNMNGGEISGNTATYNGGGIAVDGGVNSNIKVSIAGGTIGKAGSPNTAENGGGIGVMSGMVVMTGAGSVSYNEATSNGGGIYLLNGSVTLQGGAVSNNKAKNGGGVHTTSSPTLEMTGGVISNNVATVNGGGVNLSGTLTMTGGSIEYNTAASDGGGVYVDAGTTFNMTTSTDGTSPQITSNNAKNGGGVYLVNMGILGMGDGIISGNTATTGAGVYDNGMLSMAGAARIDANNELYLSGNADPITITSILTGTAPVATISPFNHQDGTQVLAASSGVNLAGEVGKFTVTASGSDTYVVKVDDADFTMGVLAKGISVTGATAAAEIAKLSGSETYTVRITGELTEEQITGADAIRAKLIELVDSQPNIKVILDLSGSTITSLPDDAFYSSNGNSILIPTNLIGVVFPSSLETIGCGTFRNAGLIGVVFVDSEATWKIEGRNGTVAESSFQPSATNTAATIEYLTGPAGDRNMEMDFTFTNAYKWTKN